MPSQKGSAGDGSKSATGSDVPRSLLHMYYTEITTILSQNYKSHR